MTRTVRTLLAAALVGLVVGFAAVTTPACNHTPPNIVTTQGKAAYAADEVVARFSEFSDVVKADTGTQPGNIAPADAFTIIEWVSGDAHATPPTTGLIQIIQTTAGQGWKAAALQSWQSRIKPIVLRYPKIAPYADIVDSLLEVL